MELTLTTADKAPADLVPGDILCGDDGVPFAVVSGITSDPYGTVWATCKEIPSGAFDVRGFSREHRFMRTQGHTGITTMPTYPLAVQCCRRDMARRTEDDIRIWSAYSAVYYTNTYQRARLETFADGLSVEFPPETTVKVVA